MVVREDVPGQDQVKGPPKPCGSCGRPGLSGGSSLASEETAVDSRNFSGRGREVLSQDLHLVLALGVAGLPPSRSRSCGLFEVLGVFQPHQRQSRQSESLLASALAPEGAAGFREGPPGFSGAGEGAPWLLEKVRY